MPILTLFVTGVKRIRSLFLNRVLMVDTDRPAWLGGSMPKAVEEFQKARNEIQQEVEMVN
jgi:hypothetical protein